MSRLKEGMEIKRNKRVLFICDLRQGYFSTQARGVAFKDQFERYSWCVEYVTMDNFIDRFQSKDIVLLSKEEIIEKSKNFDFIILIKVNDIDLIEKIKENSTATIFFDFIDALWRPAFKLAGWSKINKILSICDKIICENDYIGQYAYRYNKNIYKTPFLVPISKFELKSQYLHPSKEGKVVIGWVGSKSTVHALKKIKRPLEKICQKYSNVEVSILGAPDNILRKLLKKVPYKTIENYDENIMVEEVLKMDIGVFPPPGDIMDYKLRGANKGTIYMGAKKPTIFQKAGDCLTFIEDGVNGFFAQSEYEWFYKLDILVSSKELRKTMGMAGYETVINKHSIECAFSELEKVLIDVTAPYQPPENEDRLYSRIIFYFSGWVEVLKILLNKGFIKIIKFIVMRRGVRRI